MTHLLGRAIDFILFPGRAPGSRIRCSWALRWNIIKSLIGIGVEQFLARLGLIQCASKLNYSQAAEQAQLNGTTSTVSNAGTLTIYSGTQPSATTGAEGTTVVGPFTLGSP